MVLQKDNILTEHFTDLIKLNLVIMVCFWLPSAQAAL